MAAVLSWPRRGGVLATNSTGEFSFCASCAQLLSGRDVAQPEKRSGSSTAHTRVHKMGEIGLLCRNFRMARAYPVAWRKVNSGLFPAEP